LNDLDLSFLYHENGGFFFLGGIYAYFKRYFPHLVCLRHVYSM
jgi:hypothetical protein